MITIDNITYRNLQEQVQKNKSDIAAIRNVEFTLNNMGITVLGKVATEADIPVGTYNYGDAYLVGLTEPYDIYIFTRDDANGSFINMGPLAIVGPQGPAGPAGEQGVDGERGSKIFTGQISPASLTTTDYIEGDVYIRLTSENSFNGDVYQYKNLTWTKVGNIKGPQGDQGIQGNSPYIENSYWYINGVNTNVKAEGVDGKNGTDGKDGIVFNILGELTSPTLLPDPSTKNEYDAYLVGNNTDGYVLYVVIDGAWKKIAFSTGTQVYDGQTSVTTYDVTKLKPKAIQFKSPTIVQKDDNLGGYAITGTGIYQSQDPNISYNLDNTTIVLPLQASDDIAFNINNNKIEAKLTDTVNNKINNALQKPVSAPTSTQVVAIDTANSQTLIPIDDTPTSNSANLVTSGGVYNAINDSYKGVLESIRFVNIIDTRDYILKEFTNYVDAIQSKYSAFVIRVGFDGNINENNWSTIIETSTSNFPRQIRLTPMISTAFTHPQPGSTSIGGIEYSIGSTELILKIDTNMISIKCDHNFILKARLRTGMNGLAYNTSEIKSENPLIFQLYGICK